MAQQAAGAALTSLLAAETPSIFGDSDAQDLKKVQKLYKAEDFDFRLKPGSAAIDHGVTLPNVTDGFTGQAPDLGALELGQTPPHYGPR